MHQSRTDTDNWNAPAPLCSRKTDHWERADVYGESSYVVMMGGLHTEMASLKIVGHWLNNGN